MLPRELLEDFQVDYLTSEMKRLEKAIKQARYMAETSKLDLSEEELESLDKYGQQLGYCRSITDYAKHHYKGSQPLNVYSYISEEKYSRIKTVRRQTLKIVREQLIRNVERTLCDAGSYLHYMHKDQVKTQNVIDLLKEARESLAPYGDKASLLAHIRQNLSNMVSELDDQTVSQIYKLADDMETQEKNYLSRK